MAAFTATPPNQQELAGDRRATALKLFTGEVIKHFDEMNLALGLVKRRSITGGKSAQFMLTGKADEANISTHTAGEDVVPVALAANERIISIGGREVYAQFIDDLEDLIAQFEVRGEMAKQAGEVLATKIDKQVFLGIYDLLADAGLAGQPTAGQIINTALTGTTAEAHGDAMVSSIYAASTALNSKNVPMMGRVVVTNPAMYNNVILSQKAVNGDWTNGNGGIDTGRVFQIGGMPLMWTNHLPAVTTEAGYGTVATNLEAMVFVPEVYGVVTAMDIQAEANYIPEKLGDLLVAYYALGHGPLNPTGLVTIHSAATTDV